MVYGLTPTEHELRERLALATPAEVLDLCAHLREAP
jgi:hypothetical protein